MTFDCSSSCSLLFYYIRRFLVQNVLIWLKEINSAYFDIEVSQDRLSRLPLDGECDDIPNVEFNDNTHHTLDLGLAPEQVDPGKTDSGSHSSVLLQDAPVTIQNKIENVVKQVLGNAAEVSF